MTFDCYEQITNKLIFDERLTWATTAKSHSLAFPIVRDLFTLLTAKVELKYERGMKRKLRDDEKRPV